MLYNGFKINFTMVNLFKRVKREYIVSVKISINTGHNPAHWAKTNGYCELIIPVVAYTKNEAETEALLIINASAKFDVQATKVK